MSYYFHGYVPLTNQLPTFAIPVFRRRGDGNLYYQISDPPRPAEMCRIELSETIVAAEEKEIAFDCAIPYYCFVDIEGSIVGPLSIIENDLRNWYAGDGRDPAVKLQIAEIIGETDLIILARKEFCSLVRNESGNNTFSVFSSDSLKFESTWRILSKYALNTDCLRELVKRRRTLSRRMNDSPETLFIGDFKEEIQSFLSVSLQDIARMVNEEFAFECDGVLDIPQDQEFRPVDVLEVVLTRLSARQGLKDVKFNKSPESRISIILRSLFDDFENVIEYLKIHEAKTYKEQVAIRDIMSFYKKNSHLDVEETVGKFAGLILARWPFHRRAVLLLDYSKNLKISEKIVQEIRSLALNDKSFSVAAFRKRILFNLR